MARAAIMVACVLGWVVLVAGVLAPLSGSMMAMADSRRVSTASLGLPPPARLLVHTLVLSGVATAAGLLLSLPAGGLLGSTRHRRPWLLGLILCPLFIPPQVYAYAWSLLPGVGVRSGGAGVVPAGLITAGWLWPAASLIIASGWRSSGRQAWRLALLDTGPFRALVSAALPALRPQLVAAGGTLFAVATIEYAIPHILLARVHATELMLLVEAGAPPGQVARLAIWPFLMAAGGAALAAGSLRGVKTWQAVEDEEAWGGRSRPGRRGPETDAACGAGRGVWWGTAGVLAVTVGFPAALMVMNWRDPRAWAEGFRLFGAQWVSSAAVAAVSGVLAAAVALATVLWPVAGPRRRPGVGAVLPFLSALTPPAVLGVGMVLVYNGLSGLDRMYPALPGAGAAARLLEFLYADSPAAWTLVLAGRYAAVAVLVAWLCAGRRSVVLVDQARADGAGRWAVLAHVLWPMHAPMLLAGGMIVAMLSLSEVVATHLVGPTGFPSIALTLLTHMHYGRDDVVIAASLTMVGGVVVLMAACGRLLTRGG